MDKINYREIFSQYPNGKHFYKRLFYNNNLDKYAFNKIRRLA